MRANIDASLLKASLTSIYIRDGGERGEGGLKK